MTKSTDKAIKMIRRLRIARPRDLVRAGITPTGIARMVEVGQVARIGRGLYALPDSDLGEKESILLVAARAPKVVFCLLTALRLHGLTTQNPASVWIAIAHKGRAPVMEHPPLHILRATERVFEIGVVKRVIQGIQVRVYNPAKTVADCFKFRSLIGQDVAVEALRDCWEQRKATMDELWKYAKLNRVSVLMRTYMETLT